MSPRSARALWRHACSDLQLIYPYDWGFKYSAFLVVLLTLLWIGDALTLNLGYEWLQPLGFDWFVYTLIILYIVYAGVLSWNPRVPPKFKVIENWRTMLWFTVLILWSYGLTFGSALVLGIFTQDKVKHQPLLLTLIIHCLLGLCCTSVKYIMRFLPKLTMEFRMVVTGPVIAVMYASLRMYIAESQSLLTILQSSALMMVLEMLSLVVVICWFRFRLWSCERNGRLEVCHRLRTEFMIDLLFRCWFEGVAVWTSCIIPMVLDPQVFGSFSVDVFWRTG